MTESEKPLKYYAYLTGFENRTAEGTKEEIAFIVAKWIMAGNKTKFISVFEGDGNKVWEKKNYEVTVNVN